MWPREDPKAVALQGCNAISRLVKILSNFRAVSMLMAAVKSTGPYFAPRYAIFGALL